MDSLGPQVSLLGWGPDPVSMCPPPRSPPQGPCPLPSFPRPRSCYAAHKSQRPPSRLDLAQEATRTWQDGPLQWGPYDVQEGLCPFQHGAFDLSNDPSISSHSPWGLSSPPRPRHCLSLLASALVTPDPPTPLSPPLPACSPPLFPANSLHPPLPARGPGSPSLAYPASLDAALHPRELPAFRVPTPVSPQPSVPPGHQLLTAQVHRGPHTLTPSFFHWFFTQ